MGKDSARIEGNLNLTVSGKMMRWTGCVCQGLQGSVRGWLHYLRPDTPVPADSLTAPPKGIAECLRRCHQQQRDWGAGEEHEEEGADRRLTMSPIAHRPVLLRVRGKREESGRKE